MSASLLETLTGLITPELAGKAASTFGESETTIAKGLGAAFPAVLSGLANRAADAGFAGTLFELVRSPANDDTVLGNPTAMLGAAATAPMMSLGHRLLSMLFGTNMTSLANTLAGYAGIKNSTGASLLNLAAPIVLALLGRRTRADALNASSLANLLLEQRSTFSAALPGPLANMGTYLASPVGAAQVAPAAEPESRPSIWRWLLPLLIALALLWLLSSFFGHHEQPIREAPPPAAVEPAPGPTTTEPAVPAPSTETPTASVYFDVDQSALPAGSETALSAVIEYLRSNPGSTAVISGFHDPTGDAAKNEELAKNRAMSVRRALVAAGIDETRINTEKPAVTTGDGSLEDARRVEVTVR